MISNLQREILHLALEKRFITCEEILLGEGPEPLRLLPLVAVLRIVAPDKVFQGGEAQPVGLQGEVLVGAQIVNPEFFRPGRLAGGFAVEEEHVGLNPLGVKDARGEAQQGMDIIGGQELAADGLPGAALKEHVVGHHDGGPAIDVQDALDVLEKV